MEDCEVNKLFGALIKKLNEIIYKIQKKRKKKKKVVLKFR